ncbi:MAG TPA: precorrin-2 C(20)-methyltransferase [Stellaceae bacterium]|jgi:precorrin-2/cobalt-factor-2 C20-methyltransferase|nr:precorrin-2 C(20)-methyltransferase [Stellaceae bacterium]
MAGQIFGLGLGPGDPELITLKALRLLRSAAVVAYPAPETGDSFARSIVAAHLDQGQREIALRFPMRPGAPPAALYDAMAQMLGVELDRGADIAVLCQGDPLFYGSFAGLLARLGGHYRVTIVPGVSSMTAAAAAAGAALVQRDETLTIIPATLPEAELARRLRGAEHAVIVKIGRHFSKLRRVLDGLGLLGCALYVEHATLPTQRTFPLSLIDAATVPYFALVLVRR